jgi:hypothetical protein
MNIIQTEGFLSLYKYVSVRALLLVCGGVVSPSSFFRGFVFTTFKK